MRFAPVMVAAFFLCGCKKSTLYPLLGSTGGAAIGSVGGVAGSAGGAALGWGVGKGAALVEDNKQLASTVDALSKGDVEALVSAAAKEQRGFLSTVIEGIYDLLIICGIAAALFILVPVIYTRLLHKKFKLFEGDARKETLPP